MDCDVLKSKFASLVIVWCLVFSLFAGLIIVGVPNVGRALLPSYLDNGDVYIGSDYEDSSWTIDGKTQYMVGNLTIKAGGVVRVIDGGISFKQDCGPTGNPAASNNIYTLVIQDGGQLIMENSVLTTELEQINAFPSLGMLMQNGAVFQATKNSVLEFPGHLVVDNSTFVLTDSTIKGHSAADISTYCNSSYFPSDYFDDSPVMFFASSNVTFVNSTVTDLFALEASATITKLYNHQYAFANDARGGSQRARTDTNYTLSRAPSGFNATANTATGSIGDIRMEDQRNASLSLNQILYINRTNLYGLVFPDSSLVQVTLHIRYKTQSLYDKGDKVYYGFENEPLQDSGITITDTAATYDPSINNYVEKTASPLSMSSEDLSHFNVRLTNTDPATTKNIYVDHLWFTVRFPEPTFYNITMAAGTKFTAIDSYLGVDFSDHVNVATSYTHNMLSALDASECYLYGVRVDMTDMASSPPNRKPAYSAKDTSVSFTPLSKSASDNTNELIRNLTVYDAAYYPVRNGETLAVDKFNVSDLSGQLSSAILGVSYATGSGYSTSAYIQWNKEGATPQRSSIQPTERTLPTRNNASFDLFAAGVQSLLDIADLNIIFSIAGAIPVFIDRIWITVTLRPTIYIYRWANVTVNDAQNLPVSGADVNAYLQSGGAAAEYFTPSGVQSYPPTEVLDYLQRTSTDYTLTGPDGNVRIPLLSEFVNQTNMNNSHVVGAYLLNISYQNATHSWFYAEAGVSFDPYPALGLSDQTRDVNVVLTLDVQTASADLVVENSMVVVLNGTTFTYGKVVVRDNGILHITNGGLNISQGTVNAYAIFVYDNAKVYVSSATLSSSQAIWMYVFGNGMVSMNKTTIYAQISIRLEGLAKLNFESSVVYSDVVAPTGSNAQLTARNTTLAVWSHFGGNAVAKLTSVVMAYVRLADGAVAYHYRWINVTVLDGTRAPLPNATVQLRWNVNETLYQTKKSNSQGYALFEALSDMIYPPATTTFYGNYKLNATFWFEGQSFNSTRYTPASLAPYSQPLLQNDKFVQLLIAGALPDLDPPFYVTSPNGTNPNRGDPVTLTVNVSNIGVVPANNVLVRFKDNTSKIIDIIIPKIVPHQTVQVQTVWTAVNPGKHNLSVILDPEGAIPELNKHNNENWTIVNVWGIAELSISTIDVTVVPLSPTTNTSASISIVVHNIGDNDANDLNWSLTDIVPVGPQPAIRYFMITKVAAGGTASAAVSWTPTVPGAHTLLIKLNVGIPPIPEHIRSNNNVSYPVTVRNYADFATTGLQFTPNTPYVGELLYMDATVTNVGETTATQVLVYYWLGAAGTGTLIDQEVIGQIDSQQIIIKRGQWQVTPNTVGKIQDRTITVQVDPLNQVRKIGHASGTFSALVRVIDMRPDLQFVGTIGVTSGGLSVNETTEGQTLVLWVTVKNDGYSTAQDVRVQFRINGTDGVLWNLGNVTSTFLANETKVLQLTWRVTVTKGNYTLRASIDPLDQILEVSELNNQVERLFLVKQATPVIEINLPSGSEYRPDVDISVYGYVKKSTADPQPLQGAQVTAILRDMAGQTLVIGVTKTTAANGYYSVTVHVPANLQGDYRVYIQVTLGGQPYENHQDIKVTAQAGETSMPFWVWILIILFVLAIIVAFSIYLYRYGLGKMVECGECGALIPESSKKCPKCGTEFETGTAKCSQCGAWIPVTAAECPECGARFVTEPMAEEEDEHLRGMRQQYGAHVDTFREQGKAALGKKYNESRFMEWWKKQSSYVSFEKWLSREEEKRKSATGATAFPCPVCGTLNPKGSTVCHKCGTVFDQKESTESPTEGEQKPMRRIVRRPAEKKLIPKKEAKPEEPKSEEELPEQPSTEGPSDQAPPSG